MAYIEDANHNDVLTGTSADDNEGTPEMMPTLTDAELDVVSAGAASATLSVNTVIAIGPNDALVTTTESVYPQPGDEPSNTAFISLQYTATSN